MPEYIKLALYALALASGVMTLVWYRQVFTKNAGIVDGWWSYNFGLITLLYFFLAPGDFTRKLIILIPVLIWSIRLGTHLLIRNTTHEHEDTRYAKLRKEYGQHENFRMWVFFMYQAISNVILTLPFLVICVDPSPELSTLVWIGLIVWVIAVIGESVADQQLKNFKKDPANKGKVCEVGLWNYSRHPNYFFEWLIWVGFALIALDSPYGYLGLICPVIMYILLNNVTGIPMLEELAVKSKGERYVRYQKTTSAFFPWFKSNAS